MADFVAVLKKTIEGLSDPTPVMRERVYEKARATVASKLAAINPAPPAAIAERQRKSLEDAIRRVEAEYSNASPARPHDPIDELENVFASLNASRAIETAPARTPGTSFEVRQGSPEPVPPPATRQPAAPPPPRQHAAPPPRQPAPPPPRQAAPPPPPPPQQAGGDIGDYDVEIAQERGDYDERYIEDEEPPRRRAGFGSVIAALILLAAIGGGAYAAYLHQAELKTLLGLDRLSTTVAGKPEKTPASESRTKAPEPAPAPTPEKAKSAQPETDTAAAPAPAPAGPAEPEKLTQRLNSDGSEVDEGPATDPATLGEGTSVAAVTPPAATPAPAAETPPSAATASPDVGATPPQVALAPATGDATVPITGGTPSTAPAAAPAQPDLAVGQKAIFYEERTNLAQGSADMGSIVWSMVQESPGGDLPPEPAIRAEATIPGKDLQLRMTIRRNGDPTLPASHIIEMIFLTPEGFEGGGIENILRVSLKDSEQSAGNPLLGIPAKIADGFFLVALNDTKSEIDANLALLRRDQWIDVPIVYKSGRRALITMEKGIPGEKVFDETLRAWQAKPAGSAG